MFKGVFNFDWYDQNSPYVNKKMVESLANEISRIITDQIFKASDARESKPESTDKTTM